MKEKEQTDSSVGVSVRLPSDMLETIDQIAEDERRTRGNVIRILLEDAIAQRKK